MATTMELLPLEGSTSNICKHFGFPDKNRKHLQTDKKMRICFNSLQYCGNTGNLHFHLTEHHHSSQGRYLLWLSLLAKYYFSHSRNLCSMRASLWPCRPYCKEWQQKTETLISKNYKALNKTLQILMSDFLPSYLTAPLKSLANFPEDQVTFLPLLEISKNQR